MNDILKVSGLRRSFTQGGVTIDVLRGIDLTVGKGEIVALLGPSGSGKSTLLQAVGLLEGGFDGSIRIDGEEAAKLDNDGRTRLRRDALGFVYQFHHLLPDFNAAENVILPQVIRDREMEFARARAESLLTSLGLGHRLDHRPDQLSGGEKQRVAIARALIRQPQLLLCDEPTGNLDAESSGAVAELLFELHEAQNTILVAVTHSEELASRFPARFSLHHRTLVRR